MVAFVIDESHVIETWTGERKIQIQNAHFIFMHVPHNLSDHSGPLSQTIPIFCKRTSKLSSPTVGLSKFTIETDFHVSPYVTFIGRSLRPDIVHFRSACGGTEIFLRELALLNTLSSNPKSSRSVGLAFSHKLLFFTSGRYDTEVINSAPIFLICFIFFHLCRAARVVEDRRACGGDDNFR